MTCPEIVRRSAYRPAKWEEMAVGARIVWDRLVEPARKSAAAVVVPGERGCRRATVVMAEAT